MSTDAWGSGVGGAQYKGEVMKKRPFSKRAAGIISTFQPHRSVSENIRRWLGLGRVLDHLEYDVRSDITETKPNSHMSYIT